VRPAIIFGYHGGTGRVPPVQLGNYMGASSRQGAPYLQAPYGCEAKPAARVRGAEGKSL